MFKKLGLAALVVYAILKSGAAFWGWTITQNPAALGLFVGVVAYEAGFFFLVFRIKKRSGPSWAKRLFTLLRV